jgi:protoheme IX farnesyltransferase
MATNGIAALDIKPRPMMDFLALTKPRITWLILMSTAVGFFFGLQDRTGTGAWAWRELPIFLYTVIGTALIASGTAALNQWFEREADGKMRRTETRPLPAKKLTPRAALWFGITLAAIGFAGLSLSVNVLSGLLGLFTLAAYLFIYTPLKQRTSLSTVVGALPGAVPPLIGFAAASGHLNAQGWALFAILFLWQFPHFLAIAWMYREDYARAGILMLPVVEPDGQSTSRQIVAYASTLIPVSLLPTLLGMTGRLYILGALILGLWFLYAGMRVAFHRSIVNARKVLLVSVIYLPLMYGLMILDHTRL